MSPSWKRRTRSAFGRSTLARARSSSCLRTRFVLFIDNQASSAVLVKARSISCSLNAVLRQVSAILLCPSNRPLHAYTDTNRNPTNAEKLRKSNRVKYQPLDDPSLHTSSYTSCARHPPTTPSADANSSTLFPSGDSSTWLRDMGPSPTTVKDVLISRFVSTLSGFGLARSSRGLGCRRNQWVSNSAATTSSHSGSLGTAAYYWKREEPPRQAPPLTGPVVFALLATALAWNVPDVTVLIAVAFGGLLRTVETLTLQRHHLTVHSTCALITLPSAKTGKRTGETQSVIVEDGILVLTIDRLMYYSVEN